MLLQKLKLKAKQIRPLYNFYKDVIGLPVSADNESISITAGESKLIFDEATEPGNPFYHFAFNIPSNKIEEAVQWLQHRTALLWMEDYNSYVADFKSWHAKSVYFLDPAGNIGELIARFDLYDIAGSDFSADQFRNISEIGLVFPDTIYDEKVNGILRDYQLEYFVKQPPLEHFRAIGNDEGLFIAVPKQRNWFSTKMPSGIFPISIEFLHNNKMHQLHL